MEVKVAETKFLVKSRFKFQVDCKQSSILREVPKSACEVTCQQNTPIYNFPKEINDAPRNQEFETLILKHLIIQTYELSVLSHEYTVQVRSSKQANLITRMQFEITI